MLLQEFPNTYFKYLFQAPVLKWMSFSIGRKIVWGRSAHIQGIRGYLKELRENTTKVKLTQVMACDIRNYLIAQMCFTNATRCSNIRNMTVDDVDKGVDSPTIKTVKEINSTMYKTSIFYGKYHLVSIRYFSRTEIISFAHQATFYSS